MKTMVLFAVATLLFAATAGAEVTTNVTIPLNMSVMVPCAAGGTGEIVLLGGELHILFTTTMSASGQLTLTSHFQPVNVKGQGSVTGDKYQATGVTRTSLHVDTADGFPYVATFVNNFRIVGQGPNNNFVVHANTHVTINPDGTVTADVTNLTTACR